ncbi:hypothetical protein WDW89_04460 [Deltaproteobacteria bacterium TL4]
MQKQRIANIVLFYALIALMIGGCSKEDNKDSSPFPQAEFQVSPPILEVQPSQDAPSDLPLPQPRSQARVYNPGELTSGAWSGGMLTFNVGAGGAIHSLQFKVMLSGTTSGTFHTEYHIQEETYNLNTEDLVWSGNTFSFTGNYLDYCSGFGCSSIGHRGTFTGTIISPTRIEGTYNITTGDSLYDTVRSAQGTWTATLKQTATFLEGNTRA